MIYLDNAATGGFKPRAVTDVAETVIKFLSANPGRSSHRLAITGSEIILSCREKLSAFFGCSFDRVIFTKNCTESLNLAIFGTVKKGGHVITTTFEHNSVLRPLFYLERLGLITLDVVSPLDNQDISEAIESKINDNTYLIVCTLASNVTGEQMPYKKIGEIAKRNNLLFLVDGAQGAGHIPVSIKDDNISLLAVAGHKGLYGIMGSGALLINDGATVNPISFGGSGVDTFNQDMPENYPERLEAGTLNLPAIASLKEGVNFISANLTHFREQTYALTKRIIDELSKMPRIKLFSKPNPFGIVSFLIEGFDSQEICDILNSEYDIAVRGGFHCAPLTHKYLNTVKSGLIRVSVCIHNSASEISHLLFALRRITNR